jgi:hypothetical protein
MITDFTILPLGADVELGKITTCPKCGKPGLYASLNGHSFYTHSQTLVGDEKRGFAILRGECHIPPVSRITKTG